MQLTEVDGAYSWIVAGSSFFLYMMMYGTYRLSGILFVASMPRYGVGREAASFPYTFAGFTKNVSGPLVGIMLNKFRIRTLILSGCALAAIGIAACFFAENIFVVTVLWGVVFGFGMALACSLMPVLINQYFFRQRATAAGFAFSGMCVGTMVFPLLVEICIEYYGISGTFLIISGLVLNCFPLAIFLRARIPHSKDEKKLPKRIPDQKTSSTISDINFVKKESQSILQQKYHVCGSEKTPLLAFNGQIPQNDLLYSSMSERTTMSSNDKVENNFTVRHQTFLSGSIKYGPKNNESLVNVPSDSDHQTSWEIDRKPLTSSEKGCVGEIDGKFKSNESNGKNDMFTDSEQQDSLNVLTSSLVSSKTTSCDQKENIENNDPSMGIIYVSGTNQSKDLDSLSNDLFNHKRKNDHDSFAISATFSNVHITKDLNEKETLLHENLSGEQKILMNKCIEEDNIFYENDINYCNYLKWEKSRNFIVEGDTLNGATSDGLCRNRDNMNKSDGKTAPGEILVASSTASQRECNDKLLKNAYHPNSYSKTQSMNIVGNLISKRLSKQASNNDRKNDRKNLIKVIQDTTIAIVPDNSNQHATPYDIPAKSTKVNKSMCSGNCSLLLSFTYLVVLFTKTLSNSISLCVNTVIFDYARDIGIATVNDKYILIFSSMGELLGRLSLGRVADFNCMSNSMLLVICSVGQGLGALAIAWSTGFYFLGVGLFVYAFMGSVVQFMMPLIIADGIVEDKQAFAITSSSFLAGPASLLISPLIGYLRDEIGTYTYLFYGIGVLCGLIAIIWLIGYFMIKPKPLYAKIK